MDICRVWTALRFKDRMVKVIMDVSALKDQKKGIVLQSTVSNFCCPASHAVGCDLCQTCWLCIDAKVSILCLGDQ